ncbi:hypothetical protein UNPF46_16765, partial [Bradyrhizobium sp. UNPF46]
MSRIAFGLAAALLPPNRGRPTVPRRRREAPAAVAERQLAGTSAEFRRRARPQEALRLVGRVPASQSGPGSRQKLVLHLGVRASACRQESASLPEPAQHQEPVIPPGEEARLGGRAAVYRGALPAIRRACCQVPALRSAQALPSVRASLSVRAQVRRGEPRVLPSGQAALPWAQVRAGLGEPLPEVAEAAEV